ncbi:MAG: hypothetical protein ICV66_05705, partial [Chitinophagaceae bacterium]|nr:hypothetical protein [Chitinophagaceae bacterium]
MKFSFLFLFAFLFFGPISGQDVKKDSLGIFNDDKPLTASLVTDLRQLTKDKA